MFGADHHFQILGPKDYEKYYDRYMWDIEEPVGNETAAAFYFVARITSEKVKVAMSGQGADEPWAGYRSLQRSEAFNNLQPNAGRDHEWSRAAYRKNARPLRNGSSAGRPH